jgi:phospholipid transport system substrate-binding protein
MNTVFFRRGLLVVLGLFLMGSAMVGQAATPDPSEQLKPFIEKITAILKQAKETQESKCKVCQRIIDVAHERFDFEEMSKRVLGREWQNLNAEQRATFVDLFTTLLQWAYIGKIEEYSGQSVQFKDQRVRGNRAEVQTLLVDAQRTIPVSYIMVLKGDQWMTYDVVVEGVSLVRNYMEQFREILRKEDFSYLGKQVEDKISELEKQNAL